MAPQLLNFFCGEVETDVMMNEPQISTYYLAVACCYVDARTLVLFFSLAHTCNVAHIHITHQTKYVQ